MSRAKTFHHHPLLVFSIVAIVVTFLFAAVATEGSRDSAWAEALPQVSPSESECQPYIQKAIKELHVDEREDESPLKENDSLRNDIPDVEEDLTIKVEEEGNGEDDNESPSSEINEEAAASSDANHENDSLEEDDHAENDDNSEEVEGGEEGLKESDENDDSSHEDEKGTNDVKEKSDTNSVENFSVEEEEGKADSAEESDAGVEGKSGDDDEDATTAAAVEDSKESDEDGNDIPEEELIKDKAIPKKLRNRQHIADILSLHEEDGEISEKVAKIVDSTLKELKKLYDAAIKPMEMLYKYRDLSNRHFGDAEIFSKPLILFMGPWSGGKSTIINYLLDNEFSEMALRSGAEPSPAYFNIVMSGENETILDGTQLAADWTFSGLQKFGQGMLDRLKGFKLNKPLLEKMNIVEIPGILEIRKQVQRMFPFNDACQWFIDRADIIFLVYDPAKLDVGPETEAILDQLKGREYQTRILLNKADHVKAEELMRVQSTLIWNISPLMSSAEPPVMYTTSLWSIPYEKGSPTRLLHAQERAFLKDLKHAVDKRVENKISSARRFAVRVRNHAKMVDCYLTTYYNHKSFFGNRKAINQEIIEHPQNYHIYEGLSTLTNISRYDLPDPESYRDFFRLHPIYEFQRLSDTCTYFRGCPINKLDIAIAYDLPDIVGKYKKAMEALLKGESVKQDDDDDTATNKTRGK